MQQEKCLPGIFIILHCSTASINELISGLDRELSTALAVPLGCSLALFWLVVVSAFPGTREELFGAQRGYDPPKNDHHVLASETAAKAWPLLLSQMLFFNIIY